MKLQYLDTALDSCCHGERAILVFDSSKQFLLVLASPFGCEESLDLTYPTQTQLNRPSVEISTWGHLTWDFLTSCMTFHSVLWHIYATSSFCNTISYWYSHWPTMSVVSPRIALWLTRSNFEDKQKIKGSN